MSKKAKKKTATIVYSKSPYDLNSYNSSLASLAKTHQQVVAKDSGYSSVKVVTYQKMNNSLDK